MYISKILMGHMIAGHDQDTGWIGMTQLEVADLFIPLTCRLTLMDSTIVMIFRDIIFITTKILIGGVRRNICRKSSRNPSLLLLMGM